MFLAQMFSSGATWITVGLKPLKPTSVLWTQTPPLHRHSCERWVNFRFRVKYPFKSYERPLLIRVELRLSLEAAFYVAYEDRLLCGLRRPQGPNQNEAVRFADNFRDWRNPLIPPFTMCTVRLLLEPLQKVCHWGALNPGIVWASRWSLRPSRMKRHIFRPHLKEPRKWECAAVQLWSNQSLNAASEGSDTQLVSTALILSIAQLYARGTLKCFMLASLLIWSLFIIWLSDI